jgi:hypothetical protein
MQIDAPSPGLNSKGKPRKNSVSQGAAPQLNGGKKKHGQSNRRGTASVEPSPANLVMQLPPNSASGQGSSIDSPQSVQASPNPAYAKKDEGQSTLGIGAPPMSGHSPAPIHQQLVSGPPKKRMKTETPGMGNVPLPGGGSHQGTPQQPQISLAPHMAASAQQPPSAPRYSASPAPAPGVMSGQQPHLQYPGQLAYNYGPLGLNIANGMMANNGTGQPGYNALQGMQQQPQAPNMHANLLAAQNQQQAATRAGSPHSLPPSRPASQASIPMRNSPRPPAPLALGPNGNVNLQPPQPDQQGVRPGSAPGQQGMPQAGGMHQPQNPMQMQMPMDPSMQMAMFQQMQAAQRMGFPGAPNMMQYPGFPMQMQMPGHPSWRMPTPGQMAMGAGRGQPIPPQYAALMQQQQQQIRRNAAGAAMQAPPNPPR